MYSEICINTSSCPLCITYPPMTLPNTTRRPIRSIVSRFVTVLGPVSSPRVSAGVQGRLRRSDRREESCQRGRARRVRTLRSSKRPQDRGCARGQRAGAERRGSAPGLPLQQGRGRQVAQDSPRQRADCCGAAQTMSRMVRIMSSAVCTRRAAAWYACWWRIRLIISSSVDTPDTLDLRASA
jgi:hypothetical protein